MKKIDYTLGVVSVSFRAYTPEEIIKATADAGLCCIEWGSDVHAPATDTEKLKGIAALQSQYGIHTSSYGTYFRLGITPIEELVDYINAAKILGTDILRLWCGNKSGADMTEEERNALLAECKRAADIAKAHGVTLCMECHRSTFTEVCDDAVLLMKEIDSPNFKMYWQPFQWQSFEDNLENASRISKYAVNLHVFNWRGAEKLPLADATLEWRAYLKKFDTPHPLLLEFMPGDSIEELKSEADALRKIINT